jgi:DNA polymerase-3 subunit alpha
MADKPFVHLHCHSHYSLLDGASRVPELVGRVKELGMNAVALTDHGNLYGAIELYRECQAADVRPIIGYEAYVAPGKRTEREARGMSEASFHLTLLACNRQGFQNLIRMASLAFLDGFYYRPRIDKELLAECSAGIICLSGCAASEFNTFILKDQVDEATRLAEWFAKLFGDRFFIEIQHNGLDFQNRCTEGATDIARKLGIPLVATADAHYLCQSDADAHDVLLCVNTGKLRSDANRMRYTGDQYFVRSPDDMYSCLPEFPDAVRRSQEIADRCDVQLDFRARHFPVFHPPAKLSAEQYLRQLCEEGLKLRYGASPPPPARERLDLELGVIERLGFAGYFLIVWDFVRFAHERGIPAGARGSACGSLVSFVLKISHVDPLEYDLLFERFLDPNRAEAPDIDIDFCQNRREEVLQYVREKYGEASVAQIATFGTMAARAAVRDVGRVLGIELARVDQIAKLIPKQLNITLDDALHQNPDLKREYEKESQIRELIDIARKLEGTNRNIGTHAAGVVIADGPLIDFVPVQRVLPKGETGARDDDSGEPGKKKDASPRDGVITTQWTMEDLEKVGMLKMDFLGLRTLTLLDKAVKLIEQTRGVKLDIARLPLDDAETFALLQRGDSLGVFQFESEGIRNLLQRLKPDNIRDIIACTALYRPGPLGGGMVDAYVNRKHGREKPAYQHPVMAELLAETYGVMVYQEQVMRILNRLGGIELSSAYACIKAISKKKHDVIQERRAEFIAGAQTRGVNEGTATEIFDLITHFGGYGFNKSHSTAYALVSYQTAFLKAKYPPEFLAAVLTSEIGDADRIGLIFESARRGGLEVLLPDVNRSEVEFTVDQGKVVFGLAAIRGLGRKPAEALVSERRANGPYRDIYDLCERVDQRLVSRSAMETLVKAGAFDGFGLKRAPLFAAIPAALQAGSSAQEDRRRGQRSFFEALETEDAAPAAHAPRSLVDMPEWSDAERLSHEKAALGFYLSSHPLARHSDIIERFSTHRASQLPELGAQQEVVLGGMLSDVRFLNAKKSRNGNTRMARFKFVDLTGSAECVLFPDDYLQCKELVKNDTICFAKAIVDRSREEAGLIVNRLLPLEQAQREFTRGVVIRLSTGAHDEKMLPSLGEILRRAPGRCPVYLQITDGAGKRATLQLAADFAIDVTRFPQADVDTLLGKGNVLFHGMRNGNGA